MIDFNPRAHEGHDLFLHGYHQQQVFQSTCPRGARLKHLLISIHVNISIHVPTRGTTTGDIRSAGCNRDFNPRAHEGHDWVLERFFSDTRISIHVPTRGTTEKRTSIYYDIHFNPRAHEGHDVVPLVL